MIAGVPKCPHLEWELVLTQFQSLVLTPSLNGIQRSRSSVQFQDKEGERHGGKKKDRQSQGEGRESKRKRKETERKQWRRKGLADRVSITPLLLEANS